MITRTLLALTMVAGTASAPKQGTLTYTGQRVTCAKMVEVWRDLHVKPMPCRERKLPSREKKTLRRTRAT